MHQVAAQVLNDVHALRRALERTAQSVLHPVARFIDVRGREGRSQHRRFVAGGVRVGNEKDVRASVRAQLVDAAQERPDPTGDFAGTVGRERELHCE